MPQENWWIWMALAAVFAVGEIFTAGFFLLWFAIGSAVAGVLTLLGFGAAGQFIAFGVVSGVLFVVSRRFAERWTSKQPPGIGADRLVGRQAVVLEKIDNLKAAGRVRVEREEWRAESGIGDQIPAGSIVEVVRVDGTRLVVKPCREEE